MVEVRADGTKDPSFGSLVPRQYSYRLLITYSLLHLLQYKSAFLNQDPDMERRNFSRL